MDLETRQCAYTSQGGYVDPAGLTPSRVAQLGLCLLDVKYADLGVDASWQWAESIGDPRNPNRVEKARCSFDRTVSGVDRIARKHQNGMQTLAKVSELRPLPRYVQGSGAKNDCPQTTNISAAGWPSTTTEYRRNSLGGTAMCLVKKRVK